MGGGGKGGGGGGGSPNINVTPSPYEQALGRIANELYDKTNPLRDTFIQDWMGFLRPQGYGPAASSGYIPDTSSPATPAPSNYYGGWAPGQVVGGFTPTEGTNPVLQTGAGGRLSPIPSEQLFRDPQTGQVISGTGVGQYMANGNPFFYLLHPNNETGYVDPTNSLVPLEMSGGTAGTTPGAAPTGGAPVSPAARRYNPYSLPGYGPIYDLSRSGLESQYNVAKQNLIGNSARGGLLNDSLAQLEQGRAQGVGSLPAQIGTGLIQDIMNKAYGAAWNAPGQSMSGLSSANAGYVSQQNAALQAQMQSQAIAAQQSNAKGSGLGMLGMGVGQILGGPIGGGIGGAMGRMGGK